MRRQLCQIALIGGSGWLGGCAWWDRKEAQLALRPSQGRPAQTPPDDQLFRAQDQRWLAPLSVGQGQAHRVALWWLPNDNPAAPGMLYLHGTFRNLFHNISKINALRDIGFSVLAVDYRGWGESTAITPDEDSIAADAALAWGELKRRQPVPSRRVIFGHSMGGAVAVRLADTLPATEYGAVALESTFTRMPDVASAAGFWGRVAGALTRLRFDSLSRIGRIKNPLLMLHGSDDTTVPVALGRRLRDAAAPGVQWVEVPKGTHSRLHTEAPALYRSAFERLIQQLPATAAQLQPVFA